jgi:hypothetical protein
LRVAVASNGLIHNNESTPSAVNGTSANDDDDEIDDMAEAGDAWSQKKRK